MVSHSPQTIREYCDAGVVLEDGRMTYHDDLEEALARHGQNMTRPAAGR
jgi:capsular polysaccharide transport system ATP-binding protein